MMTTESNNQTKINAGNPRHKKERNEDKHEQPRDGSSKTARLDGNVKGGKSGVWRDVVAI